ncbi:hypothetical protein B0H14DRAFT_2301086, partial [Mycena olivaceomarginata]
FDIVHVKDSPDRTFATRCHLLSLAGAASRGSWISLPTGKGTKLTFSEERDLTRKRADEQ